MLRALVLDIEGTTSATSFVKEQLYPYSAERLADWIDGHPDDEDLCRATAQVRELIGDPEADTSRIVAALHRWLAEDRKVAPLKSVQGKIWEHGFSVGDLTSHFYPDAVTALRKWREQHLDLYVFSSGSVNAQRAWFKYSPYGDLLPLISDNFDTENAGPKQVPSSYRLITANIHKDPSQTVFLSDLVTELDAAREAGWHTVGVCRLDEPHSKAGVGDHLRISSLEELDLSGDRPDRVHPE